jgi:60 kDa SS-A/Ro ribonucleoprotein
MSVRSYTRHLNPVATPQTQPLCGQVQNSAGGYSYEVDPFTKLDRFLILGSEGGSYYAGERELTIAHANCVLDCAKADPHRTVNRIVEISVEGRAPKNDPAIFALALLASNGNLNANVKTAAGLALAAVTQVCRTGTHLFQFVEAVNGLRGWGRGLRRAVANWYLSKDADKLAYQVTKYAQRNGWSHRDVLRLAHPVPANAGHKDVFQYVTQREKWLASKRAGTRILVMAEEAKTASISRLVKMIREEGLVREHIPTERLNEPAIWAALLEDMPITAMVRNLNKMTEIGLLAPLSNGANTVATRLRDTTLLKQGRVHPFNLLVALKTYASGQGFRGGKTWTPVPEVVSALEDAFYLSFGTIEPTGKRHLYGIDVSGSMCTTINNTNVQCRSAAACLAMLGMRTEPRSYSFGFTNTFQDLKLTAKDRLDEAERKVYHSNFGTTDCAVPMTHALQQKLEVDVFVVLTDSETYAGRIHPSQALQQYRDRMGIDAKLIVVGMVSNGFTIADPKDAGQLDVVGFDTSAPAVMADFARGDRPNTRRKAA